MANDLSAAPKEMSAPVRASMLSYGRQSIDEDDIAAVVEVLLSDWLTTGPKVAEFEERFAAYVGSKYAVSFSSGTAALHGACFAAELGPGDEAVTTPLTFCATANCIVYVGATPVFADVSPGTLNINPTEIERHITPRTKAILPVDYAGQPADLEAIVELARSHSLVVIEDASHALGATYKDRRVGSISDMTVFSFHPVKHITTGEGGMVTTDDERYARRLRLFRNHGIDSDVRDRQAKGTWYYEMIDLGFNYRLSDIGCALGISQLKRIELNLARRRQIAAQYAAAFEKMPGLRSLTIERQSSPSWHLYPILLNLNALRVGRGEIFSAFRSKNVGANVHYIPVHRHPYYRQRFGYKGGELPIAEAAYEALISLPMYHAMTDEDVSYVTRVVGEVMYSCCS